MRNLKWIKNKIVVYYILKMAIYSNDTFVNLKNI